MSHEVIINISREGSRRLDINYKFPNSVDFRQAKAVVEKILNNCASCLKSPELRIGLGEFQANSCLMNISVWINSLGFQDSNC
jgi:small conductance mechanosensitive channel